MPESTTYRVVQALKRCDCSAGSAGAEVEMRPAVFCCLPFRPQRQVADDIPMIALPFMKELVDAPAKRPS